MKTYVKDILLIAVLASILVACGGPLKKNDALLEAESSFNKAKADPEVLKHAARQLDEAGITLRSAAEAETTDQMNTLAYIGNNEVQTALEVTAQKHAEMEILRLGEASDGLALKAREYETQKAEAENVRLQQQLAALQAEKTDRGMVMTLGDVLFETGKAELMPGAMNTIVRLAQFMQQYPEKRLQIEGHTDSTGSASFNLRLSEDRANSVRNTLLAEGVSISRIQTIGYGLARPVATNATAEGRQRNRRVEIVIQ